ncbi:hypothetical protein [Neptunomonas antarctica]|uniref:Uncharacterized protein n=1 Tax=Neptunomonas antarctica TaxID=619304 RepID=A0A1N7IZL2_9GAMM|nr:hypothetical protein [Neptunomonas antarctica]SIS42555.1 hypothetical protein SAMN05421760_101390 [Neptunomonas antarctica]
MHILIVIILILLLLVFSKTFRVLTTLGLIVVVGVVIVGIIIAAISNNNDAVFRIAVLLFIGVVILGWIMIRMGVHVAGIATGSVEVYVDNRIQGKKHDESLKSAGGKAFELLVEDAFLIDSNNKCKKPISTLDEQKNTPAISKLSNTDSGQRNLSPSTDNYTPPVACCLTCRMTVFPVQSITNELFALDKIQYPWLIHQCWTPDNSIQDGSDYTEGEWQPFQFIAYGGSYLRGRVTSTHDATVYKYNIISNKSGWHGYWNYEPVFLATLKDTENTVKILSIVRIGDRFSQLVITAQLASDFEQL